MHRLLDRQLRKCFGKAEGFDAEMARFVKMIDDAYQQNDADRALIERSMELSSHELLGRNRDLAVAERKFRAIFENSTEGIFQTTSDGRFLSANPALAAMLGFDSPDQLISEVADIAGGVYADPGRRKEFVKVMHAEGVISQFESQVKRKDGQLIWISESARALREAKGQVVGYEGTVREITAHKRAEAQNQEMHRNLLAVSRQAGMAEVATGVLHNVGNVLNSINVSVELATERLRSSQVSGVAKLADLLRQENGRLPEFFTNDERGKRVPEYVGRLSEQLATEQRELLEELSSLAQNVDHVKRIVMLQQCHAKPVGITERIQVAEFIHEALQLQEESLTRHRVQVVRDFQTIPPVEIDKHRVLQILVNLMANAKQAMQKTSGERKLIIRAYPAAADATRFVIQVRDTGMGIPRENLIRIFSHGFSTKSDGHGFGLHVSALAAKEMGGSLEAASDGVGTGATFTLELPLAPNEAAKPRHEGQRIESVK